MTAARFLAVGVRPGSSGDADVTGAAEDELEAVVVVVVWQTEALEILF